MKVIVQFLLKIISVLVIKKYRPLIIAVTGSVGKTSTKEGIYSAFSGLKKMRKSSGNLNTEIGAPLVFLGEDKPGESMREWMFIIAKGVATLLRRKKTYPEIIVTELAADKPGDMQYLANFIKPDIAVVTAVGDVPVHVEFYKNAEEVAKEKKKLVDALSLKGTAVLNFDDFHVSRMETKGKKITFGFKEGADVLIKDFRCTSTKGSSFTLRYKKKEIPVFLKRCIGNSFAYIAASVFAVGVALGLSLEEAGKCISKIRPEKGRLFVIKGKKETTILDGSYNAAPASVASALDALKNLSGNRKIAVLGDMLELGRYAAEEHRKMGKIAAEFCDYVFTIGVWAEEMKKAALHNGMRESNVFAFDKAEKAAQALEKLIAPGDIILIKGSQKIRTEKIVFSLMQDPEKAEELLVRQTSFWKKNR